MTNSHCTRHMRNAALYSNLDDTLGSSPSDDDRVPEETGIIHIRFTLKTCLLDK